MSQRSLTIQDYEVRGKSSSKATKVTLIPLYKKESKNKKPYKSHGKAVRKPQAMVINMPTRSEQYVERISVDPSKYGSKKIITSTLPVHNDSDIDMDNYVLSMEEKQVTLPEYLESETSLSEEEEYFEEESSPLSDDYDYDIMDISSDEDIGSGCGSSFAVRTENGSMRVYNAIEDAHQYCRMAGIRNPYIFQPDLLLGGGREGGKKRKRGRGKGSGKGRRGRPRGRSRMIEAGQLGLRNPMQMKVNYPVVKEFWRYNEVLTTDGSGNISAFVSLRNPLTAINGSGVYQRAQDLAVVYDEFKVLKTAVVVDFLFINPQVGDIAISTDYDSVPAGPYTYGSLVDTQYVRIFNGTNQISYSTKVPRLSEGTYRERPAIIHQGGFYDFNTPPDEGFIALAFERYTPNTRLVRVTTMMEVLLRRRRTLNATADEEELPKVKLKK